MSVKRKLKNRLEEKEIFLNEYERIDDLKFKNLYLIQDTRNFCFGVDSVLLSDFAKNMKKNSVVMDIGSGTGIISILLSKKQVIKKIYDVEIQKEMADVCYKNIKLNNLENLIEVVNCNIKDIFKFVPMDSLDAIVTNPPYKKMNSGIKNENEKKLVSRHEVECTLEDILLQSSKLLKDYGELYMIHRPERLVDIIYGMRKFKLEPKKIRFVCSKSGENAKLVLIKAIKNGGNFLLFDPNLIIYDENGNYTDELKKIYNIS